MGLPTSPLQKAIDSEELLVIVNDRVYVPGDFLPKAEAESENGADTESGIGFETDKAIIELDGLKFSLEECESGKELFYYYLEKYQREIEEEFICTSDDTRYYSERYREYVLENRMLEFILSLFERLKPEIGYKEHLKMNGYKKLDVPDRAELEGIINEISERSISDLEGEIRDELKLVERLKTVNRSLNNRLILKGVAFPIESINAADEKKLKKDAQKDTSPTLISINGVKYYVRLPYYDIREFKKITTACEEVINNELKWYSNQCSSSKRMELVKRKRAYLQKRFDEGDYLPYGLVFKKIDEEEQYPIYTINMVLPTYKVRVPRHSYDIVFQQARLETTISINYQGQIFQETPITYSIPRQHPLVISMEYNDRNQVCLRKFKKELEHRRGEGLLEYLAAYFLLDRHVLFYGSNMFDLFDNQILPLVNVAGVVNPHSLSQKKYTIQRVPRGQDDGILLIDAKEGE